MGTPRTYDADLPSSASRSRPFESVLFECGSDGEGVDKLAEPDFFGDLNLDRVVAEMTAGADQSELKPFFYASLRDVEAVRYRQQVLRDLERVEVRASITRFRESIARMRRQFDLAETVHYPLARQAWFLEAVATYCDGVRTLSAELSGHQLASRGLRALRTYLAGYAPSDRFTALAAETQAVQTGLAGVRYAVRIQGLRVTVTRYEGEPDYSAQVEETFSRFKQGAVGDHLVRLPDYGGLDHVEAQILACVARLYPDVFAALAEYCARHPDYLDATIARFDREVEFYLAYLDLIEPLRSAGLPFCYPRVSTRSKDVVVEEAFDIALAGKLVPTGRPVVRNDFCLDEPERIFVVTGPNNGGKTTFARMFGQLHHLAGLGLLVPGVRAQLFLPDRIYTHFERQEDIRTLRGKLEDDLVRVHAIVEGATSESVIVMNESFNSTTLNDALVIGTDVMNRILALGALGVYVTFVDEIASMSDATVSMVSQIRPEDPTDRTFKVVRTPADGLAYAWAIAEKYNLTYERLKERIGP